MAKVAAVFDSDLELQKALDTLDEDSIDVDVTVLNSPMDESPAGDSGDLLAASRSVVLTAAADRYPELEEFDKEERRHLSRVLERGGHVLIAEVADDQTKHLHHIVSDAGGRVLGKED